MSNLRPVVAEDLLRFNLVSDPQIHPSGSEILFGNKTIPSQFKSVSHLYSVNLASAEVRQLTQGEKSCTMGRWRPGTHQISFVSQRSGDASQIFLLPEVGEASAITQLPEGSIGDYEWSPNGEYVALTFREDHSDFSASGIKTRKEKGLSDAPWVTESLWYRLDGDGYFGEQRFKLHLLHVASGKMTLLTERAADGVYSFGWSPDSTRIAVCCTAEEDPIVAQPNDQLFILDLDGNETMVPNLPKGEKESVVWSPNGKWLVYAGDVDQDDPWGTRNTKIYKVRPDGSDFKDLTGHQDYDFDVSTLSDTKDATFGATIKWLPDSSAVISQVGVKGETQLVQVALDGSGCRFLTCGQCSHGLGSVTASTAAIVFGSPLTIPEIATVDLSNGDLVTLTQFNHDYLQEVELAVPQEHWVTADDGTQVHTWVLHPKNPNGAAVIEVHGGPHTQYGWVFFHEFQVLVNQGYTVVYSNPRGSKGYGQEFCAAIRGDWGNADWVDIQAVSEFTKNLPGITRMGIMGGSYGGYMTNWAIGHSKDYKAAITDRCVSNMVSMAGNSDFPFNKDGYFKGVFYGDLERISQLWKVSPIAYFEGVTTPTLIIHSEGDLRCNIEQGEQVFSALRMQGVPSRFVRYPKSTSHGLSRSGPADLRIHRLNEILSWWERYLA